MSKIILQPSSNKDAQQHYEDTVKNDVLLTSIQSYISSNDFRVLNDVYPSGACKVWGVTPSGNNSTKWSRIENGDVTLFSKKGFIYASAVTTYKLHSPNLAKQLWGLDDKGQTWEYIYFLDELKNHKIPYKDFNRVVGYADNFVIQGFGVLKREQSSSVFRRFNLESEVFIEEISNKTYEDILSKLELLEETESEIFSTRRLEQGYLKRSLFGNKVIGICGACKKEYPVSYLVTAHIKKRAYCKKHERKDLNIVMPMCKMGCDEIYEKGYLSVLDGLFVNMGKTPISPDLKRYINQISGTKCHYYNENTKDYFDWHYEYHK
ncbi:HNH endonuclease [Flagellimonas olearia]|uniref:HNH endonuclease n=1 Tax=Flagellimonas olearia TaxID=552546 RepID=A0A6I1DXM7_9FLAO|nr:HNH endonuclease [Allomuricauda olearia]KAB7529269.1 HNH endonuclease [Allomuricauda olearia]